MLLDSSDFIRRWEQSGSKRGAEHQVILNRDDRIVEKRTNAPYFHNNWRDYLDRIAIHNFLFPETGITVKVFKIKSLQLTQRLILKRLCKVGSNCQRARMLSQSSHM
jgi:hypothetical protein